MRIAPGIDLRQRVRARVRNPHPICSRKIENGKVAMVVTDSRPECQLHINRDCDCNRDRFDRRDFSWIDSYIRKRPPKIRAHESNYDYQSKKRLGETSVKDSDFIF